VSYRDYRIVSKSVKLLSFVWYTSRQLTDHISKVWGITDMCSSNKSYMDIRYVVRVFK